MIKRFLVVTVGLALLVGCEPAPSPYAPPTREELKQVFDQYNKAITVLFDKIDRLEKKKSHEKVSKPRN